MKPMSSVSRRTFFSTLASASLILHSPTVFGSENDCESSALPDDGIPQNDSPSDSPSACLCGNQVGNLGATTSQLRIALIPPDVKKIPDEVKILINVDTKWELMRRRSNRLFERELVPGIYSVKVEVQGQKAIQTEISVTPGVAQVALSLVTGDTVRSILINGVKVFFQPRVDVVAILPKKSPISGERYKELADAITKLGLTRTYLDKHGTVLILQTSPTEPIFSGLGNHVPVTKKLEDLEKLFGVGTVELGFPINGTPGQIRVLTPEYLVRFQNNPRGGLLDRRLNKVGAEIVSPPMALEKYWIIRFKDRNNYLRHLDVIEEWRRKGVIEFAEPNLWIELAQSACFPDPNDPWLSCQKHFINQHIFEARCYIKENISEALQFSSSEIVVGIIDGPINLSTDSVTRHNDVGMEQVSFCTDLTFQQDCCRIPQDDTHGMLVYGIIGARNNNEFGISGIAPQATFVSVGFVGLRNTNEFRRVLEWTAAIPGVQPPEGISDPNPSPATIINISQELVGVLPTPISEALCNLTLKGRGGLGTVVVCSSGNQGDDLFAQQEGLAMNSCTVAVGNTYVPPNSASQEDVWHSNSNFGLALDLCAMGEDAPSTIYSEEKICNCAAGDFGSDCSREDATDEDLFRGITAFGKTSAAAPMVTAAAALILAIDPLLAWQEVREILRETADKIDRGGANWMQRSASSPTGWASVIGISPGRGPDWFSEKLGYGRVNMFEAVKLTNERRLSRGRSPASTTVNSVSPVCQ